jgi:hypothetical protein
MIVSAPPNFYWRNVVIEDYDKIINELREYVRNFIIGKPAGFNVCETRELINLCPVFDNWLTVNQLSLRMAAVIHIDPGFPNVIHVDNMHNATNPYALNFDIQNCSYSTTKMFSSSSKPKIKLNAAGVSYAYIDPETCQEESSFKLKNPIIFDAAKPHQVSDIMVFPRISITFRFNEDPTQILNLVE